MPGTLAYAAPTLVMPGNLCTAFSIATAWPEVTNGYPDGNYEGRVDGVNPRHQWALSQRLTYAAWLALKALWSSTRGYLPFYFYPNPQQFDATGANTVGRYVVRFDGQFPSTYGLPRWDVSLSLIEIA